MGRTGIRDDLDRSQHSITPLLQSLKPLFTMWKYPRMVAWFLVLTALLLGSRLVFQHAQMIPFRMDFNPVIVLVPLAGVFWGPAGAWSSLAAMLLGDHLIGSWGELTFFRAAGTFLFALTTQRLWDVSRGPAKGFFAHHPGGVPRFVS